MPDVFSRLVGQNHAIEVMRRHAHRPVHAYLFTGPAGSSLHDAMMVFAAALQCPDQGCGHCEACRLVISGNDPDVYVAERAGLSWRIDELREAERVSRRRPLAGGYQVVVLEDIDLTVTGPSPSAPALLKSLEEPPGRTIFLLSAEEISPALDTIVSRCVEVRLGALSEQDVASILVDEGADPSVARTASSAARGNLRRARVLVRDEGLGDRMAQWRSIPERLRGTPASASELASEVSSALDGALGPLTKLQDEELARRLEDAREMGQRSLANRKDVDAQFKREQRRFRVDELRFGLSVLTEAYRERLHQGLEGLQEADGRAASRVAASVHAVEAVAETARRLSLNVDEGLLLTDLMLTLMEL